MVCASCGATNAASRRFCLECGTALASACPACGEPNEPNARFCGSCGVPMAPGAAAATGAADASDVLRARASPVAERRLVSVLFADLVGFTPFAEGRDAEEVRETLSRYFELATDVIGRYGGTVEKFIGDAVMAVWGAPDGPRGRRRARRPGRPRAGRRGPRRSARASRRGPAS